MKSIGLLKAVQLVKQYPRLPRAQQLALQDERLRALVAYARANSPYFQKAYASLPADFKLSDLPPTQKAEMMTHFDDWLTDRSIALEQIQEFMQDLDHIGRKFKHRYQVFTTSGSTGQPAVVLYDETANNLISATNLLRSMTRAQDMRSFIRRGGKSAGVYATGGFYLGNSSVRSRLLQAPWKKRQLMITSVLNPVAQTVAELNRFQPAMLGSYPTALELLMEEQKQGRLHIAPVLIMAGGEYLSPELRRSLSETFSCYVQTSYSCTEGGTLACECSHQHYHINDDWLIIEAVDQDNRPVPDGVQSDKILLTNLANFTQPFIRYEITDRIVMHSEPCACGNRTPWLEIEGRTDEILYFESNGQRIGVAPLALYALLKEVPGMRRFQLISHPGNRLELRLECAAGQAPETVFQAASQRLRIFLTAQGVPVVDIHFSAQAPQPHPQSGKFKHIYRQAD